MKQKRFLGFVLIVFTALVSTVVYFGFFNNEEPVLRLANELLKFEDIERAMCTVAPPEGIVLRNQDELNILKRGICKSSPPKIDFSKNSVLGRRAETAGCGADFDKKISRDNTAKEIRYSIKITPYGNCKMVIGRDNWVVVDKIPSDFKVVFEPLVHSPSIIKP